MTADAPKTITITVPADLLDRLSAASLLGPYRVTAASIAIRGLELAVTELEQSEVVARRNTDAPAGVDDISIASTDRVRLILRCADLYAAVTGLSEARVSTLVFNHGARLKLMRDGADIRMRTATAAMQWFSDHWPSGVSWPHGIARPQRSAA